MGKGDVCCYEVLGMSTVACISSVPNTPVVASVPADTMLMEIIVNKDSVQSEALLLWYMALH